MTRLSSAASTDSEENFLEMAPRRKVNRKLPPQLSELIIKLIEHADSFIRVFDNEESKMKGVERVFEKIGAEVKEKLKTACLARGVGIGVGLLGLLAAPFTGGASLAAAAAVGTVAGVTITVGAMIALFIIQNGSAEKLERLGKEFMKIVKPMNKELAEIMAISEKLEQKSTEIQDEDMRADMEEFQKVIRRVGSTSVQVKAELQKVIMFFSELVRLIMKVMKTTLSPEEDKKLPGFIIKSGAQCRTIIRDFNETKKELQAFKENVQVYIS